MANISIRKLDEKSYETLKKRATRHGISMEEEARQILYSAVETPPKITRLFKKYFGPNNGIDLDSLSLRTPHEPLDLNE